MALNKHYFKNYIKLEYIQSDGRSYIDTGVVPGDINSGGVLGYNCTMDAMIVDPIPTSTTSTYVGAFYSDNSTTWVFLPLMTGSSGRFGAGMALSGYQYTNLTAQQNVKFNISTSLNYGSGKSNFEVIDQNGGSGSTSLSGNRTNIQTPIYLFARNYYNSGTGSRTIEYAPKMRIYHFTLDRTEGAGYTPILDLIPSKRKSDSVVGLYDAVNNVFYANAGTGQFVPGPELSSGYTFLDYIESTGTQYFNLSPLKPNELGKAELAFTFDQECATYAACLLGCSSNVNTARIVRRYNGANSDWTVEISNASPSRTSASNLLALGTRYEFDIDFINLYGNLNGTPIYTFAGPPSSTSTFRDLYLLADNDVSGVSYKARGKLEYFVAYDRNAKLIHNLLPAKRNSDNVIGMYDEVNNVFCTNAGSGQFIPGPEVSDYTFLEYIESTGTQYINTRVPIGNRDIKVIADFQYTNLPSSNQRLFGARTSDYICFYLFGPDGSNQWKGQIGAGGSEQYINGKDTNRHIVTLDNSTGLYQIDETAITLSTTNYDLTYYLYIFCQNNAGNTQDYSQSKIYSFKIYKSNTLIRYFMPAMRNSDGVIGLYDKANDVFYPNKGTGEFIGGQPVWNVNIIYDESMGSATGSGTYIDGEDVTLVATPKQGCTFKGWFIGDVQISQDESYTFTIDHNINIFASFEYNYDITINDVINCNITYDRSLDNANIVLFNCSPNEEYMFKYFDINGVQYKQNPLTLTLTDDVLVNCVCDIIEETGEVTLYDTLDRTTSLCPVTRLSAVSGWDGRAIGNVSLFNSEDVLKESGNKLFVYTGTIPPRDNFGNDGDIYVQRITSDVTKDNFTCITMLAAVTYNGSVTYDLGYTINKSRMIGMGLESGNAQWSGYRIYIDYSEDGANWITFYSPTSAQGWTSEKEINSARYFRLRCSGDGSVVGMCSIMLMEQ